MKMPSDLPRWDCRNSTERQHFEAWTNARLDDAMRDEGEPGADERRIEIAMMADQRFMTATEAHFTQQLKRGRVLIARDEGDTEALAHLADTPELRLLALTPRKRGRPHALSTPLGIRCAAAANDMKRMRAIWQQHYTKQNRNIAPTAVAIAARRYKIAEDKLIDYLKNHRGARAV